jgi:hypothetical protein
MYRVAGEEQMVLYYPCCRKPVKWAKGFKFTFATMAALTVSHCSKKHTTDQHQKCKDFILDCVQKTVVF